MLIPLINLNEVGYIHFVWAYGVGVGSVLPYDTNYIYSTLVDFNQQSIVYALMNSNSETGAMGVRCVILGY